MAEFMTTIISNGRVDLLEQAAGTLRAELSRRVEIPESEWEFLRSRLRPSRMMRHQLLLRQGEVCRHIHFIVCGLLRIFQVRECLETNLGFDYENRFFTAYDSFLTQSPSRYGVETLEPTEFLSFDYKTISSAVCPPRLLGTSWTAAGGGGVFGESAKRSRVSLLFTHGTLPASGRQTAVLAQPGPAVSLGVVYRCDPGDVKPDAQSR